VVTGSNTCHTLCLRFILLAIGKQAMKSYEQMFECSMKKYFFSSQEVKQRALEFLEENRCCAIYMDDENWVAVSILDSFYPMVQFQFDSYEQINAT
jgi:hypothetical protein